MRKQVEEERRLEEESGAFLGVDQFFTDDIQTMVAEGRFVSPDDLLQMVEFFVEQPEIAGKLTRDDKNAGIYRLRLKEKAGLVLLDKVQSEERSDRASLVFNRWLQGKNHIY